ncbi:MAG: DUF5916 domain-containing protein [Bacteroidota bacterium]
MPTKSKYAAHALTKLRVLVPSWSPLNTAGYSKIIKLQRHTGSIVIDGLVDSDEWDSIVPFEVLQKVPDAGAMPSQKTEIRMTYDALNIYLSCRSFDEHPELIVANTKKRDDFTENTEWCGFLIDSYDDRENALAFFVTPTNAKLDMALSGDIEGPSPFNLSWDSFWDAAVSRTEEGWFSEIKVPFSSLSFEEKDGKVVMGVTAFRYLARNDETDIFPPRDPSLGSTFKPSLTQRVQFEGIVKRNPIRITSYGLSGFESINESTSVAGAPVTEAVGNTMRMKAQVGLDAKVSLSSNATLDLTVNTDFAQVEADDQQINLTRTNLFFPEKRLFFQERASLFDFAFGTTGKVFHSRRIGIVNGQQTRILGGVRALGKFGKWEAGILSMQSAADILASENFGVVRVRRKVLNENSTVGFIVTNRNDFDGNYNAVYGFDATLKILRKNYFNVRIAQSISDSTRFDVVSGAPTKLFFELEKRSFEKLTYKINFSRAGATYNPAMGYEQRSDFSQLNARVAYNFFPNNESQVLQAVPYHEALVNWSNALGYMDARSLRMGFQVFTKAGWLFDVNYQNQREVLAQNITFPGNILVSGGSYDFGSFSGSLTSPSAGNLSYATSITLGKFYNANRANVSASALLNVTPDFIVQGSLDYNRINGLVENERTHITLARLKLSYAFSTKLFLSGFSQYNNVSKSLINNFHLRYTAKDGNDFYLVYNAEINQVGGAVGTLFPEANRGTLLVKYSHTFHK